LKSGIHIGQQQRWSGFDDFASQFGVRVLTGLEKNGDIGSIDIQYRCVHLDAIKNIIYSPDSIW
jgi:hypothetical protein